MEINKCPALYNPTNPLRIFTSATVLLSRRMQVAGVYVIYCLFSVIT